MIKKIITLFILLSSLVGQTYQVGDYVDDFGSPICANGEGYWSYEDDGRNKVVWINLFTSWWPSCTQEAPVSEYIYQNYINEPVVVLGIGHDWNQPYSCESWATTFGLTYPVIDDATNIYGLFGTGYIPHNIVIDGEGRVLYSDSGFNESSIIYFINQGLENLDMDFDNDGINDNLDNCIENYNPAQLDDDYDGIGNVCDQCDNNVFVRADLNGDGSQDIIDVIILIDVVLGYEESLCAVEAGDINDDGILNVLDIVIYLQDILNGTTTQAMAHLQSILTTEEFKKLTEEFYYVGAKFLFAWPNPSNEYMNIAGNGIVTIYDMMGREVNQIYVDGTYRWNTRNLPTGIYYLTNGFERIQVTLVKWINGINTKNQLGLNKMNFLRG